MDYVSKNIAEEEQQQQQRKRKHLTEFDKSKTKQLLIFNKPFDENGLFYFIGTEANIKST